jgi:chorismate dehydratase
MAAGRIRLGAVGYLNARPLIFGLEHSQRFDLRDDTPSECARLLHAHEIDVGLIPSIEYLRGPAPYWIVPGVGVTSRGPVRSVALYTRREPRDIRTVAMDSNSRTSVALATVLLRREFGIAPAPVSLAPDLEAMLERADAALIIGDVALFLNHGGDVRKIDLGELWTASTGLPFVYACWTGWPGVLDTADVVALQDTGRKGAANPEAVARTYCAGDPSRQIVAIEYLRNNIRYEIGDEEIAGLETFYRYAAELNLVRFAGALRFFP